MNAPFIHLHVHSEYSLVDGLLTVDGLIERAVALGMPAVALTDPSNLYAVVKFYRAAIQQGVKPLCGAECRLMAEREGEEPARLVLLVQDLSGYRALARLLTRAWREERHRGLPVLRREWIEADGAGLIVLSGGAQGDVAQCMGGRTTDAKRRLERWLKHFGDRYCLSVARCGHPGEAEWIDTAVTLAARHGVPLVATNDVCFATRADFDAHEARVCIQDGRTLDDPHRPRRYTEEQYLKSTAEMEALFADLPEALANTLDIARRCNLELVLDKPVLPAFPTPAGEEEVAYLDARARAGLDQRLAQAEECDPERQTPYRERLDRELGVIGPMGFAGYFLIVADFIRWAREHDIPVGPGRGSGAGSLVAWSLGITDVDPLRHDLLFERFLNPERVSMPDFDIDFCMDRRDEVIEYVARRYGRERVSQIVTHGSMKSRAVVRDVGRVLGHPYPFVDRIAKLIPFDLKMTLDKALSEEEELARRYNEEDDVKALIDLARRLEGLARNAGKHAGGVVIAPTALTDFTPLWCEEGGEGLATQLDKDDVEAIGLVKFDFLGLRTLTIIDNAIKAVNRARAQRGEEVLELARIPMEDAETFALLQRAQTAAVFQLESRGMRELIRRLQPDCFEDIVALVALYRPGPLQSGMVDDFIARKHGRSPIEYPHPALEPILKPTYGVILYQEQVMEIARVLAGYTLGGADLLRRAMGKKKPQEMAEQRDKFQKGAAEYGVAPDTARFIFDLMEKFAGYGFNKSHSVAYALIAWQTAWLKAHHPAEFMAATLSADMDHTDKVVSLIDECRDLELTIRPPDVNRSVYPFVATATGEIVYGLGAIKGVGQAAVEALIAEREARGPWRDLAEFCLRIDAGKINKAVLEALIQSGAMDVFGTHRAALKASLPDALRGAEQHDHMAKTGQNDLFGIAPPTARTTASGAVAEVEPWDDAQRLTLERNALGLYLTGHPVERYRTELARLVTSPLGELSADDLTTAASGANGGGWKRGEGKRVVVGGLAVALRTMQTQKGDRMAFVTLDDRSGRIEVAVFPEAWRKYRDLLGKDRVLVVEGLLSVDEFSGGFRLSADRISDMEQVRNERARGLVIHWAAERANGRPFAQTLEEVLTPYRDGACPVYVECELSGACARIALGDVWKVHPSDPLLERLRRLVGNDAVRVEY